MEVYTYGFIKVVIKKKIFFHKLSNKLRKVRKQSCFFLKLLIPLNYT